MPSRVPAFDEFWPGDRAEAAKGKEERVPGRRAEPMTSRRFLALLWIAAVGVALILNAANLIYGDLNQDEGWYLYAARLVSEGRIPYRDFAFTQAPVMPFVYAGAQPLVDRWGLAGGRLFTSLLGLAGALCAAGLALRIVRGKQRATAATMAFILISVNVYQSYFTTVAKTYSLASLFLVGGFLLLSLGEGRAGGRAAFFSGVAFALAAGTRMSAGIVLPLVALYLLIVERHRQPLGWLWFGLGGALTGAVLFGPFLLLAPENFVFGIAQYHTARQTAESGHSLFYKAGAVSRLVQAYFVACSLSIGLLLARWMGLGEPREDASEPAGNAHACRLPPLLWTGVAAITLVHFSAPFPYEDYQVMVFPLFAAALAAAAARRLHSDAAARWALTATFLISIGASFSSPINQDWFVQGRDRIWWRLKDQTPLHKLREAGALVRSLAGKNGQLLTQDTYLAVESGLHVPRGLELGPFCYYPDWDTEKARRCRVMNRPLLEDLLRHGDAQAAAFSGYGLSIQAPEVIPLSPTTAAALWALVQEHYRLVGEIQNFGQGATTLRVMVRKTAERDAGNPAVESLGRPGSGAGVISRFP